VISTKHPRLVVPAVMAILGTVIAIASWIGAGWGAGVGVELVTIVAAIGYLVLGGRDSDVGALIGSRPDERQASVGLRATALAGFVLTVVALGGLVIASAMGRTVWPFSLFCIVGAVSFVVGLLIYRDR
jgi:hypothetical protein